LINKVNVSIDIENKDKIFNGDRLISIAIMSSFAILAVQFLFISYFDLFESSIGGQIQIVSKLLVGCVFLIAIPTVLKRNMLMFVSVYAIGIFIFLSNYLFFSQNTEALENIFFSVFFICLPCLIYSFSIIDNKIFMDLVYKVSDVVFIMVTLIGVLINTNIISIGTYSISLSYYMLLPAIINVYRLVVLKSASSILKIFVSLLFILTLGSRGAVMCFGIYLMLVVVKNKRKLSYAHLLVYNIIFGFFTLGILFFDSIINFIYDLLVSYNIFSRTLYLFTQDTLYLSGREKFYDVIIEKVIENPVVGIGIAGDRFYLDGYTHNIFLEILSGFGLIIGSVIIVSLSLLCFMAIQKKNQFESNVIIIWFAVGFLPLLVSGSYLIDMKFWLFMGLALRSVYKI